MGTTIFFLINVVSLGVAADGSERFIDDDVSGNYNLKVFDRASALSFWSYHETAAAAPSYQKQSWILLSPRTSCHDSGGFGKKASSTDRSFPCVGRVGNCVKLASRKLGNTFLFSFEVKVHSKILWFFKKHT